MHHRHITRHALVVTALIAGVFGISAFSWHPTMAALLGVALPPTPTLVASSVSVPSVASGTLTLGFVGDIMLDRGVEASVERRTSTYEELFTRIAPELRLHDILFGNVEGPISDRGERAGSIYSFRMATSVAPALANVGFDVVSVANNHAFDYGRTAMEDTWSHLRAAGVLPVGGGMNLGEALAPVVIERNGVRVGYVAFSEFGAGYMAASERTSGIAIATPENVRRAVMRAASSSDLVVASFHFGEEYQYEPTVFQREMASTAIAAGADIVVGHHSHVAGPLEQRGEAVIAYSLGNFVFDQYFSTSTMEAPVLTVLVKEGRVNDAYLRSARMDAAYRPGFRSN